MGTGLFVGVWVARYLGPEQYGAWNYASAYAFLFGAFASLGVDGIVIRNLVQHPDQTNEFLGTAFCVKFFGGSSAFFLSVVSAKLFTSGNQQQIALVAASSLCFVIQSSLVIDLFYQSKSQNKYSVIAQNAGFVIASAIKIALIIINAPLLAFACMTAAEAGFTAIFLAAIYKKHHGKIFQWKFDFGITKSLLLESWPLILASSMSLLNMRIDQVFIGKMIGDSAVGRYSAAVRIAEIWLMIPVIFGQVIFPIIVAAKEKSERKYRQSVFRMFQLMSAFAIPFAIFVSAFSNFIIQIVYGNGYTGAGELLSIQIWTGVPSLMFFVFGQVFYVEKLVRYHLVSAVFQPICNICLNLLLIPKYGAEGAAIATLITAFGSHIISLSVLEIKLNFFSRTYSSRQSR